MAVENEGSHEVREMKRRGVNLSVLFEEYQAVYPALVHFEAA
jgi:hypothetical protein